MLVTQFHVVGGDKGGVGKSVFCEAIIDFLVAHKVKVALIEADTQNPDVARMFAGSIPSIMANLREENGWMDMQDFVAEHPEYTIILNTPAGIGEYMKREMPAFSRFLASRKIPIELHLWWTMNHGHDSVNLLGDAYKHYGENFAKIHVVCNLFFTDGRPTSFFLWQESPLRTRLEKAGGRTIYFPALHVRVVSKLFAPDKIMPFSEAVDAALGESLDLMPSENHKLEEWLSSVAQCIGPVLAPSLAEDEGVKA